MPCHALKDRGSGPHARVDETGESQDDNEMGIVRICRADPEAENWPSQNGEYAANRDEDGERQAAAGEVE